MNNQGCPSSKLVRNVLSKITPKDASPLTCSKPIEWEEILKENILLGNNPKYIVLQLKA